jgi:signal transduction histidine kinase
VTGLTLTLQDVTREREMSRMKSNFVSFATHQLRTPLSGISWLLELGAGTPDIPEEARSYLDDARQAAQRLITLVNDLLDVSRLESGKLVISPQATDLAELTASVIEDVGGLIRDRNHRLTVRGGEDGLSVHVDPQLVRQVLMNMLSNAIKYTPPGGEIEVDMTREETMACWSVRDNGIGIPRANQARLFEKFYRADNTVAIETEGTGLGLHIARVIAERSGGSLSCESEEGRGSTFFLRLPLEP